MLKVIFKIILMFVGFCVMVAVCVPVEQTVEMPNPYSQEKSPSKYPVYTISQAQLLVDTGKCTLVRGTLSEFEMAEGMYGSRTYETRDLSELYNAIDTYVELDKANASAMVRPYGNKYGFTTMRCNEG